MKANLFHYRGRLIFIPLKPLLSFHRYWGGNKTALSVKALSHKTTFLAFCLSILTLRCKVARNAIRPTPNNTRKLNMSRRDVYLPHKRRVKWTRLYNVQMAAWCNENVATHGSFVGGVRPGKFFSLNTANRNTYESRRVTISWLCKAAGQEILISDWVNTNW